MASKDTIKVVTSNGPLGWVLFVAWAGAVVYFFQQDQSFWGFLVALVKAAVWPGYLIFHALQSFGI